jgi:ABC-2 type transport system permease protein
MRHLRLLASSFRFELLVLRTEPNAFIALATAPLFAIVFLSVVRHAHRDDLIGYAALAPLLISMWRMSTDISGEVIGQDRSYGTLEPIIATPASYGTVLLGRIMAVSVIGLISFAEIWLVVRVMFGTAIRFEHPTVFVATLAAAVFAMSGTALVMASVFALGRSTRIFQQTLTYPFYLLGGVIVPVAFLPRWLQPLSRLVFLSWAADLLRDALTPKPVANLGGRLAAVVVIGTVMLSIGGTLVARALRRVQRTGTLGYA